MDTIFAQASGRGRAGVAVVRVSGPLAFDAVHELTGSVPRARQTSLRVLRDGAGEAIDEALVIVFEAGRSFTGEPVAEFHLHGSLAVVGRLLRHLGGREGFRPAEAGEFTRRAMENGRLDLAQVEGLADLIEAETEMQRRQAMRVFSGALSEKVETWRGKLVRAGALIEATIDFADEDVPVDVSPEVAALLGEVPSDLANEIAGSGSAERLRDGFEVAIVGRPNVGKSTLLNYLAGREAAITSEVAGTTRDVIEVRMDLQGLPVTLLDTAGLRETDDRVESIGVDRARLRAEAADLRVFLVEDDGPELAPRPGDIILRAKADLAGGSGRSVSGKTGQGVPELVELIVRELSGRAARASTATRERHRLAMGRALASLESARNEVSAGANRAEIAAEHVRGAARALESLIGRVDVEQLLDEIFASFCIGK
jgi:tRNA modification GTPase